MHVVSMADPWEILRSEDTQLAIDVDSEDASYDWCVHVCVTTEGPDTFCSSGTLVEGAGEFAIPALVYVLRLRAYRT